MCGAACASATVPFICVTWLIHTCATTHVLCDSPLWVVSLTRATYEWVVLHCYGRRSRATCESCLTCTWVVTHIRVSLMNASCLIYEWVVSHCYAPRSRATGDSPCISHVSFMHELPHVTTHRVWSHVCPMSWIVTWDNSMRYGVATVSRIDKIIGLFCRILPLL